MNLYNRLYKEVGCIMTKKEFDEDFIKFTCQSKSMICCNCQRSDLGCDMGDKRELADRKLVKSAKEGDLVALNKVIEKKSKYVKGIIKNDYEIMAYKKRGLDQEDLFQSGMIGLLNAVKKFDFRDGIKFDTYLAHNVKYSIKDDFRDYGGLSVSREASSIYSKCSSSLYEYDGNLSDELLEELSEKLYVTKEKISKSILAVKIRNAMYTYTCDGEIEAEEQILYKYKKQLVEDYESKFEKRMLYREILNQIKKLSDKERYILENLYIKDRTQVSIAQELGCSNTAVGKIKKNAIKKIRKNLDIK